MALLGDTPPFTDRVRHPWRPGSWRMTVPLEHHGIADDAMLHLPKQQLPELAEALQSQSEAPPALDAWGVIGHLVEWLDSGSGVSPDMARLLRVLKIQEEAGEVAEAIHGAIGSNPRKGNSHTWNDVQAELCDVIFTSMVALRTITPDAEKVFAERLDHVAGRSLKG